MPPSTGGTVIRWHHWGGAVAAGCATVLVALSMPVPLPEGSARTDPADTIPDRLDEAAPEHLGPFLAGRRWGTSFEEVRKETAPPVEPDNRSINPALARMGFVGLIVTKEQRAVLLESPEGGVTRIAPGGNLPDGRALVSVTDNSITLLGGDGFEEVLTLFPPVRRDPAVIRAHDLSNEVGGARPDIVVSPPGNNSKSR